MYIYACIYMRIYICPWCFGGARGVMVIVVEKNGHGDTSSNPGQD